MYVVTPLRRDSDLRSLRGWWEGGGGSLFPRATFIIVMPLMIDYQSLLPLVTDDRKTFYSRLIEHSFFRNIFSHVLFL